jgi:hypothetical protein
MRKIITTVLGLAVIAALSMFYIHLQKNQAIQRAMSEQRDAIQLVFNRASDIERKSNPHNINGRKEALSEIASIPVSTCPTDFRMAWSDFTYKLKGSSSDETRDAWHQCVLVGIKYGAHEGR